MFGFETRTKRTTYGAAHGGGMFEGQGLVAGTLIATTTGWVSVDSLQSGDLVMTLDHGMQMIVDIKKTTLCASADDLPDHMLPVHIPAGALGNKAAMSVPPEQGVMVETADDGADVDTIIPAGALIGYRGISRDVSLSQIELYTLCFVAPQVVYAEGGLLAYCPRAYMIMSDMMRPALTLGHRSYDVLTQQEAAFVVDVLMDEEDTTGPMPTPPCDRRIAYVA